MKFMSIFESLTGSGLKDCILNDNITFIVNEGEMGKALGKGGNNVKRVEGVLKKKIKVVEFNPSVCKFVMNLLYPLHAKEVKEEDNVVSIYSDEYKTKCLIIGRDKHRLNFINSIVKRYFPEKDVKVQ